MNRFKTGKNLKGSEFGKIRVQENQKMSPGDPVQERSIE
jgi:hypothetical protein